MTGDEIIKLASEAASGMLSYDAEGSWRLGEKEVERFATLVRDAVLEEVAAVCETGWKLGIGGQYQGDVFAAAIRAMKEQT